MSITKTPFSLGLVIALLTWPSACASQASLRGSQAVKVTQQQGELPPPLMSSSNSSLPLAIGLEGADVLPGQLLVLAAEAMDVTGLAKEIGASVSHSQSLSPARLHRLLLPSGLSVSQAAQALSGKEGVLSIGPNRRLQSFSAPNDTAYARQWGHRAEYADAEAAWAAMGGIDASKVIAAVLDSGVDANHPELVGRVEPTIHQDSHATGGPDDKDHYGHGTFCAGVIAAAGNNNVGVAGVAWQARILPVKLGPNSNFDVYDAIAGVARACDYRPASGARVRVVNMSFGVPQGAVDPLYEATVAYARRRGVLLVAAVGNDGQSTIASPANTPGVLAVGATTLSRDWEVAAPFSNYGERLDLVAPGGLTFSTFPSDTNPACELCLGIPSYGLNSGTSFAAPYVAGVAALCFAKFDANHASLADANTAAAKVDAIRQHLLASVDDLGPPGKDPVFGYGRINVRKALAASALQSP